jgi:hypothetical protein
LLVEIKIAYWACKKPNEKFEFKQKSRILLGMLLKPFGIWIHLGFFHMNYL